MTDGETGNPPMAGPGSLLLIRYGEIGLKGQNRSYFLGKLRRNLRRCLRENAIAGTVWQEGQRIFLQAEQGEAALEAACRVFGVVSVSPVLRVPASMEEITRSAVEMTAEMGLDASTSFGVHARRADKSFPLTSPEISRQVGEAVVDATGARVRLSDDADLRIGIEVRAGHALLYGRTIAGPGGMPVASGGRVVALVSTGIDSPVAAWMMMKRGCAVIPVHFSTSEAQAEQFGAIIRVLQRYSYGWDLKTVVLSHEAVFGQDLLRLKELHAQRWACLVCKRAMLSKAAEIAEQVGASAIVTGDSLGQVASQTLVNLEAISRGISKPIFRPLIGMDKTEIMATARRIGTYEASIQSAAPCPFLPRQPITRGRLPRLVELLAQMRELQDFPTAEPGSVGDEPPVALDTAVCGGHAGPRASGEGIAHA
jgi:thiamine biosynthesis protein ThiI